MAITYHETLVDETGTDAYDNGSTKNRAWIVEGTDDAQAAKDACQTEWEDPVNGLVIDSVDHEPIGYNRWKITAHYVSPERADQNQQPPLDEIRFAFDTTGATAKRRTAISTTKYAPSGGTAPDFKSSIGVSADGSVEGVDVVIQGLKFDLTVKKAKASITLAYIRTLYELTGTVNNATFQGFAAGTVLFLGAKATQGTNSDPEVTFSFLASPNVTGLAVGNITGITKGGHQYLWTYHEPSEDATAKALVTTPVAAYVETVYPSADFAALL
jgi:hypothetical protein